MVTSAFCLFILNVKESHRLHELHDQARMLSELLEQKAEVLFTDKCFFYINVIIESVLAAPVKSYSWIP